MSGAPGRTGPPKTVPSASASSILNLPNFLCGYIVWYTNDPFRVIISKQPCMNGGINVRNEREYDSGLLLYV